MTGKSGAKGPGIASLPAVGRPRPQASRLFEAPAMLGAVGQGFNVVSASQAPPAKAHESSYGHSRVRTPIGTAIAAYPEREARMKT
jgi:hypothetical protein